MNGTIPVECFENPNVTYFDAGKCLRILVHANFCLFKAKVMKYLICIGNNVLTGSISERIENMKNLKVLFLGEQLQS